MKLTNDTQSLTITEDTVTIRDRGKTYTFQYDGVVVYDAASNEHCTSLRFTVPIRDSGKTYTFQYDGSRVYDATSSEHYTYLRFTVPRYYAYEGGKQYYQYFSIGYSEMYNSVVFTAMYIKVLQKGNKAIHITGSFTCNVLEWLRNLPIQR